ncbi:DUF2802 domain-containing protein [Shewanella surugensis]|uniref:DUF2802 domain-containing protein n=1 Tax=Shewanella surugensis TaxID=212020 RepID=A0ABT0L939_9GAMM|nr:DUF2802 domain-containing protein [Shewanella surugensis]MCL1123867.1 DUF2802 domain-containing protein [Shewanella surugensis]
MTDEVLIVAALVFVVACLGLVLYLQHRINQLSLNMDELTERLKDCHEQQVSFKRELQELRSGTIGVGRRVLAFENKLQKQDAKIDETHLQDPQAKLYSRAMKMVGLGADVEELIQECELPKAEAELLLRLHGKA